MKKEDHFNYVNKIKRKTLKCWNFSENLYAMSFCQDILEKIKAANMISLIIQGIAIIILLSFYSLEIISP